MKPRLPDGSFVLFRHARSVRPGDIVLVQHPRYGLITKSVAKIYDDGRIAIEGLSPRSTSRKQLGLISRQALRGKLLLSRPPECAWQRA